MAIRVRILFKISDETTKMFRIDENTEFETHFEDGHIVIEPTIVLQEGDKAAVVITTDEDVIFDDGYDEGYDEGSIDGYTKGYGTGYSDAENGRAFDDAYPEVSSVSCDGDCSVWTEHLSVRTHSSTMRPRAYLPPPYLWLLSSVLPQQGTSFRYSKLYKTYLHRAEREVKHSFNYL